MPYSGICRLLIGKRRKASNETELCRSYRHVHVGLSMYFKKGRKDTLEFASKSRKRRDIVEAYAVANEDTQGNNVEDA
jgi:hypothetical protein